MTPGTARAAVAELNLDHDPQLVQNIAGPPNPTANLSLGVTHAPYTRVLDRFAADGYLAIAPAIFDRGERGFDVDYEPEGMARGFALAQKIDREAMLLDVAAAVGAALVGDRLFPRVAGMRRRRDQHRQRRLLPGLHLGRHIENPPDERAFYRSHLGPVHPHVGGVVDPFKIEPDLPARIIRRHGELGALDRLHPVIDADAVECGDLAVLALEALGHDGKITLDALFMG